MGNPVPYSRALFYQSHLGVQDVNLLGSCRYTEQCSELAKRVLGALAVKLGDMGWVAKPRQESRRTQKGKQARHEHSTAMETEDQMDVDGNSSEPRGYNPRRRGLKPDPQDFAQLPSILGRARDILIGCPDMMEMLLEPTTPRPPPPSSSLATSTVALSTAVNGRIQGELNNRTRLENITSLTVLSEEGLCNAIERRNTLIHTCVISLYFHDLNLLDHLYVMDRFLLMGHALFVDSLSQALFEGDSGLVSRTARASRTKGDVRILGGIGIGTGTGMASAESGGDMLKSAGSASTSGPLETERLPWPPRSGELEMTLRAVLLDCIQSLSKDGIQIGSAGGINIASDDLDMEIEEDDVVQSLPASARKRKRQRLRVSELEQSLAFAVKDYDDDSKLPKDVNGMSRASHLGTHSLAHSFVFTNAFCLHTRFSGQH